MKPIAIIFLLNGFTSFVVSVVAGVWAATSKNELLAGSDLIRWIVLGMAFIGAVSAVLITARGLKRLEEGKSLAD